MKRLIAFLFAAGFLCMHGVFAACVDTHQFTFDEHGSGSDTHYFSPVVICTNTVTPLNFQVRSDPSGGITNHSVLVYSSPSGFFMNVNGGDVALVSTNGSGSNVVSHLIRFMSPQGYVIFYAADNSGSLADAGIPPSSNAVQIPDHQGGLSGYSPSPGQPGYPTAFTSASYGFFTEPVNPVYVLSTNKLGINLDTNGITVSWSTNATSFALYQSTNIFRATNWTAVTNTPVVSGEQNTVSFPGPLTGTTFFRLIAQ